MGFPQWTLWGMGLAGAAAFVAVGIAYLLQSPRIVSRFGLDGSRSSMRARTITGFAFALILLAFGFFLAGVPLDASDAPTQPTSDNDEVIEDDSSVIDSSSDAAAETADSENTTPFAGNAATRSTTTGAFANPLQTSTTVTATVLSSSTAEPTIATGDVSTQSPLLQTTATSAPLPRATPTNTATNTPTNTPTVTPSPTMTPSPTATPTPIEMETAVISTQGSTLWVRRTPGGQPLVLVRDGDLVILSTGHAHQSGIIWREVITVAGEIGWVQEEFLAYEDRP